MLSISTRVELPDILGDLLLRLDWLTCTFFFGKKNGSNLGTEEEEEEKRRTDYCL